MPRIRYEEPKVTRKMGVLRVRRIVGSETDRDTVVEVRKSIAVQDQALCVVPAVAEPSTRFDLVRPGYIFAR